MTFSKLVSRTVPHHNKFHSRGGQRITRVIVHHWASTDGGDTSLADPNRNASVNYFVYSDGSIGAQVPEEYRAWTSGGPAADLPSITIEVQNSSTQVFNNNNDDTRSWAVSDKAQAALVELITDIAHRHNWGSITRARVRGHREFDATACPGGYLWHRLFEIAAKADAALNGTSQPDAPKPRRRSSNMLGLMINDGEGRYGAKGKEYFATYDGRAFVQISKKAADPISVSLGAPFANVPYAEWERYQKVAEVNS